MDQTQSFFKTHSDTMAIIGVNIALHCLSLSLCLANISSSASTNARIDNLLVMIHDESKSFYGRLEKQDADYKSHMMHYHDKRN